MSERPGDASAARAPTRHRSSTVVVAVLVGLCVLIGVALFAIGMAQTR